MTAGAGGQSGLGNGLAQAHTPAALWAAAILAFSRLAPSHLPHLHSRLRHAHQGKIDAWDCEYTACSVKFSRGYTETRGPKQLDSPTVVLLGVLSLQPNLPGHISRAPMQGSAWITCSSFFSS